MKKEIVFNEIEPKRLDIFLVEQLNISRSQIKKMIDNNQVVVNQKIATKTGLILENNFKIEILENDLLTTIECNQNTPFLIKPIKIGLDIIYEDEYLMIINKPSNMLVYPTEQSKDDQITLVHGLMEYLKWNQNDFKEPERMGIVHRLDKDTSGLMIIAKNQEMVNKLSYLFLKHEIEKHYHAIVYNHFPTLNKPIKVDVLMGYEKSGKYKMRIGNDVKNGKQAISIVTPLQNLDQGFSLVDVRILTGRTHQIRATMRYLNHPIFNDPIYGPRTKTTNYGQYLFCNFLSFVHPITNEKLNFKIPCDKTFMDMYEKLNK